jgi:hypothetical protein
MNHDLMRKLPRCCALADHAFTCFLRNCIALNLLGTQTRFVCHWLHWKRLFSSPMLHQTSESRFWKRWHLCLGRPYYFRWSFHHLAGVSHQHVFSQDKKEFKWSGKRLLLQPLWELGGSLAGHKRDTNTFKSLCVESKTHGFAISTRSF